MSKRAKEKAKVFGNSLNYYQSMEMWPEEAFQKGYEQAEEDLALTWQDIKRIVKIADDLLPGHDIEQLASEFQTEESYYQEVLKRFKEGKQ